MRSPYSLSAGTSTVEPPSASSYLTPSDVELVDDRAGVRTREAGEQRAQGGLAQGAAQEHGTEHQDGDADDAERALGHRELLDGTREAVEDRLELRGHQACIRMISLNASTALLRTAAVSSSAVDDSAAAIV